jgi:hypothetical protein
VRYTTRILYLQEICKDIGARCVGIAAVIDNTDGRIFTVMEESAAKDCAARLNSLVFDGGKWIRPNGDEACRSLASA